MKTRFVVLLLAFVAVAITAGSRVAQAAPAASERHRTINAATPGQTVDINKFVVKGKTNIFDFYSKFCPPCMRMSPLLDKLAQKDPNVVVSKIDINRPDVQGIDWSSPVAKAYGLESIPHFVIYDAKGVKVAEGEAAFKQVLDMLGKAGLN